MRRLLLLRHAKAVQDEGGDDHARALNTRGQADAAKMGHALDTHRLVPDLVLCSTAQRTVETWELVAAELARVPPVEFKKTLYLVPAKQIVKEICHAPDDVRTLMIIGHNPGMEDCASRLAHKPQSREEAKRLETLRDKFPTCALAVFEFDAESWKDVDAGAGALTHYLRPKDIA